MKKDYTFFEVSLKVLLRQGNKVLLLRTDLNHYDLPGGRINKDETKVATEKIISREVKEELGSNVRFTIKEPIFYFRADSKYGDWVFIIVQKGDYLGGTIKLSKEHTSYEWVDIQNIQLQRKDFHPNDDEKYIAFKEYFASLQ